MPHPPWPAETVTRCGTGWIDSATVRSPGGPSWLWQLPTYIWRSVTASSRCTGHPSRRRASTTRRGRRLTPAGRLPRSQSDSAARRHRADGQGRHFALRNSIHPRVRGAPFAPSTPESPRDSPEKWRRLASCSRMGRDAGRRPPRSFRSFALPSSHCSNSRTRTWIARSRLRHTVASRPTEL